MWTRVPAARTRTRVQSDLLEGVGGVAVWADAVVVASTRIRASFRMCDRVCENGPFVANIFTPFSIRCLVRGELFGQEFGFDLSGHLVGGFEDAGEVLVAGLAESAEAALAVLVVGDGLQQVDAAEVRP